MPLLANLNDPVWTDTFYRKIAEQQNPETGGFPRSKLNISRTFAYTALHRATGDASTRGEDRRRDAGAPAARRILAGRTGFLDDGRRVHSGASASGSRIPGSAASAGSLWLALMRPTTRKPDGASPDHPRRAGHRSHLRPAAGSLSRPVSQPASVPLRLGQAVDVPLRRDPSREEKTVSPSALMIFTAKSPGRPARDPGVWASACGSVHVDVELLVKLVNQRRRVERAFAGTGSRLSEGLSHERITCQLWGPFESAADLKNSTTSGYFLPASSRTTEAVLETTLSPGGWPRASITR